MATPKKEVVTQQTAPAVQEEKPDYLREMEAKGPLAKSDNFDSSDIAIPRVKLLQALSKELENFDDARPGTFWHTGSDLPLGDEIRFIPVSRRAKYLLVAPLEDGQGILARADDRINWVPSTGTFRVKIKGVKDPVEWVLKPTVAESKLDKWGTYNPDDENSPPAATLFYEYLVLLPDHMYLGPSVMSLTRSQIKKAKKGLNDKIASHEREGHPMQALVFKAKVVREEAKQGTFYNLQFGAAGYASTPLYEQALKLKDVLGTFKVQGEADEAHDDVGTRGVDPTDY